MCELEPNGIQSRLRASPPHQEAAKYATMHILVLWLAHKQVLPDSVIDEHRIAFAQCRQVYQILGLLEHLSHLCRDCQACNAHTCTMRETCGRFSTWLHAPCADNMALQQLCSDVNEQLPTPQSAAIVVWTALVSMTRFCVDAYQSA